VAVIAAAVAVAALGVAPTQLVFLAAAVLLVLCNCVSIRQAYREIDVRIFVMISGVIPLGVAMQKTGTADLLAGAMLGLVADWSSFAVLLAVFWVGALLTQILSDAAAAVLVVPVSLSPAVKLGLPPQPLAICTALGAVAAFLTPIGHHGNR
jgi:di/tricarboxylate transporter